MVVNGAHCLEENLGAARASNFPTVRPICDYGDAGM